MPLSESQQRTAEGLSLQGFSAADGTTNEVFTTQGSVRPPWRYLLRSIAALGERELQERQRKALNLLRDDGASYHAYGDMEIPQRSGSWRMDLVPWVIDSEQWRCIEAGLLERAELFNLLLRDLYGERTSLQRGLIPPEVIFGHGGFLRAAQGIQLPGEQQLILHATDLVSRGNGSMCVLADRTQAPSGAGYALENRIVMTRVLPTVFRDSNVHRLSIFFQTLRHKLLSLVPEITSPNIAILTPGPLNETYFEHAFLANYLGFELVQSRDLSVRNNALWMKTLDGWTRVHVLLRRVDDSYCDPVELRGDSQLGVPGLLEVARAGHVVIANPIGTGVLESPALLPYLPAISRHFLGRPLQLPTVDTWWCGDPDSLPIVIERFDELVIKPVFRAPGAASLIPAELNETERNALLAQLASKPEQFVAQERIVPSQIPALGDSALIARPAVLRAFAVATADSYRLMPGGLTRVGHRDDATRISNQAGSISKDTWIVASELKQDSEPSWAAETPASRENSRFTGLPSRVVENMFWLGRYAERAEFGLRMTRTLLLQAADIGSANELAQRQLLWAVVDISDSERALALASIPVAMEHCESVLLVALDPRRRESLIGSVESMLACAEETKELMTFDTQRVINQLRDEARQLVDDLRSNMLSAPEDVLSPILTSLLALSGILHENVNRGSGWNFLDLGRRLERGIQSAREIRTLLGRMGTPAEEQIALESLLVSNESLVVYRRLYRGGIELHNVLELMLLDDDNPRSLLFQLHRLADRLRDLPTPFGSSRELTEEARSLLECSSLLQLARLEDLCLVDASTGDRQQLSDCCDRIEQRLNDAAVALSQHYFDQPIAPQQLLRQPGDFGL